jgi:nicotinamide mononucleotide (NMN) deamidase PncC
VGPRPHPLRAANTHAHAPAAVCENGVSRGEGGQRETPHDIVWLAIAPSGSSLLSGQTRRNAPNNSKGRWQVSPAAHRQPSIRARPKPRRRSGS